MAWRVAAPALLLDLPACDDTTVEALRGALASQGFACCIRSGEFDGDGIPELTAGQPLKAGEIRRTGAVPWRIDDGRFQTRRHDWVGTMRIDEGTDTRRLELRTAIDRPSVALMLEADADAERWRRSLEAVNIELMRLRQHVHPMSQLSRLAAELGRLSNMVTDVAEYTTLPEPMLTRVNVGDLVDGVANALHRKGRSLAVQRDGAARAWADAGLLAKAVTHLLRNVDEHSGCDVAHVTIRQDEHALITIQDDGPGIPIERQQDLWRFDAPGSGLGIPLARRIVEAQGGRLWLNNGPGTRMCMMLPGAA